ncbi:MAG: recombination protein RecR [Bacteroidales bacterium]|nr:recombination protein RecR [Bacteroidales bacterium]
MSMQNYPSRLLEDAVNEFAKLPGIGRKTALRLVLYLLKQDTEEVNHFGKTMIKLRNEIKYCTSCNNISDTEVCNICADNSRDHSIICIVENIQDVLSIENTQQYNGIYHVLGGIISPMDGIGPGELKLDTLEEKISKAEVKEIIFALSTTMEGDTTNFYIYKKFKMYPIKISTIARGVSIGDELEYADEITLGRSIMNRTPFETTLAK